MVFSSTQVSILSKIQNLPVAMQVSLLTVLLLILKVQSMYQEIHSVVLKYAEVRQKLKQKLLLMLHYLQVYLISTVLQSSIQQRHMGSRPFGLMVTQTKMVS